MKKIISILSLSVLTLSSVSCSNDLQNNSVLTKTQSVNSKYLLKGKVVFPNQGFKIQSEIDSLAIGATVSIISGNQTIATGLTDDTGFFTINLFSNFTPNAGDLFKLEATRKLNSNPNNISISTNLKWTGITWESITTPDIYINDLTTAITIINDLNPSNLSQSASINSVNVPYSVIPNVGSVDPLKLLQLINKVNLIIKKGFDPHSKIKFENGDYINDSKQNLGEFIQTSICNYCDLENSNLSNIDMEYIDLSSSVLDNSNLSNSKFIGSFFIQSSFKETNLNNSDISDSYLNNANFANSLINNSDLSYTKLSNSAMTNTKLNNSKLNSSVIQNTDFSYSEMKAVSLIGAKISNSNLSNIDFSQVVNDKSNLSKSKISNTNMSNSNLSNADFNYSILENVDFSNSNLSNANFNNSYLGDVILTNTNLTNANLSFADLEGLDISTANFSGANLSNATWIDGTVFGSNKICASNSIGQCN